MAFALKNKYLEVNDDRRSESSYERVLSKLDVLSSHLLSEVDFICLMGMIGGVKPGCDVDYNPRLVPYLDELGLSYEIYALNEEESGMAISKNPDVARALAEAFSHPYGRSDETYRHIGGMLGYPSTAIEYFIKRSSSIDDGKFTENSLPMIIPKTVEETIPSNFHHFILSPDHWREEVNEYIIPIKKAVEQLAPRTNDRIEWEFKKSKVTRKMLGIFGVKPPREGDELDIPIYRPD